MKSDKEASGGGPAGICLVTGATGLVGRALVEQLYSDGIEVTELGRAPSNDKASFIQWTFANRILPSELPAASVLIHCAWDMQSYDEKLLAETNVNGSIRLMQAALDRGIKKIIFISTISAYTNARSLYGRQKFVVEQWVLSRGGVVIRPGLVWGSSSKGMLASLRKVVEKLPVVLIPGSGRTPLYTCHVSDLANLVESYAVTEFPSDAGERLVTAANPQEISFRDLLVKLYKPKGRSKLMLPVPWQPIYLVLRFFEMLHIRPPFKSDSLVGLLFPNPTPAIKTASFRDFTDG